MSFTAIYSPLYTLHTEPSNMNWRSHAVGCGVRILDPDGIEGVLPDGSDTDLITDEYTDTREYPAKQWTMLEGFKTYDIDEFNIERLGFYYGRPDAIEFWSEVSEYTEPFQFFTSPFDGGWLHALDIVTLDGEETGAMHVVCHSGDVWMHEIPVTPVARRVIE